MIYQEHNFSVIVETSFLRNNWNMNDEWRMVNDDRWMMNDGSMDAERRIANDKAYKMHEKRSIMKIDDAWWTRPDDKLQWIFQNLFLCLSFCLSIALSITTFYLWGLTGDTVCRSPLFIPGGWQAITRITTCLEIIQAITRITTCLEIITTCKIKKWWSLEWKSQKLIVVSERPDIVSLYISLMPQRVRGERHFFSSQQIRCHITTF